MTNARKLIEEKIGITRLDIQYHVDCIKSHQKSYKLHEYSLAVLEALLKEIEPEKVETGATEQLYIDLMKAGRKIEAIRQYRTQYGAGLVEAKTAVENIYSRYLNNNKS
jgi:ribosomal protein L7/L12